jgi:hypothetical protein
MLTIAGDYSMPLAARSARTRLRRGLTGGALSGFRENGLMAADDRGIQDVVAGRLRVMIGA